VASYSVGGGLKRLDLGQEVGEIGEGLLSGRRLRDLRQV
jgi:hypothetical protein